MENVIEAIVMTCPRCGNQIIRKKKGEKDMDGGFTHLTEYEPVPDSWEHLAEYNKFFCESCVKEYKRRLDGFMQYSKYAERISYKV